MSKRISFECLGAAQKRRRDDLQSDLLRIVGAIGFSRSLLRDRKRWDEASRDPRNYEPFRPQEKTQVMIRDVVLSVQRHGNDLEKRAVEKAVTAFYERCLRDALEPMAHANDVEVVALYVEEKRAVAEAECAQAVAITSPSPENYDRAIRETSIAKSDFEKLMDRLDSAKRNVLARLPMRAF